MTKRKAVEELPNPTLITEKPFNVFILPFELLRDPSWQISTWYRVNAQSRALEKAWADIAALKQQVATLKEDLVEMEEERNEQFDIAHHMLGMYPYDGPDDGVVTGPTLGSTSRTSVKPPMPEQRSLPVTEDENLDPVLRASHVPKNFVVPTIEATSSPPLSLLNEDDNVAETHDDANVGEQHAVEHDVEEPEAEEQHVREEPEIGEGPEVGEEQEMEELGAGGYYAAEQQFEDEGEMGLEQEVMEQDVGEQGVMKQDVEEQGVGEQNVVPLDGEEEDDLDAAMSMSVEM
ncbi:hypothetical protein LTR56_004212 [Elasticomyces elasticus]|nr:hypothetical protein LTR56_004212 [Elasticomyces elasticus]KAK3655101.1 hypothetical protein LTR22_010411 [Elasticomyces elasticus]KAK4910896.1 hypothetical protein LTR49_020508 [Elasticomyces elasticus]KAK5750315.1 hypothetical protein LTS12_019654 [Elasticomyces elasticus]